MANPCPTGRRGQGRKRKPWRGPQRSEDTGLERPLTGEAGRWAFAERSGLKRLAAHAAHGSRNSVAKKLGQFLLKKLTFARGSVLPVFKRDVVVQIEEPRSQRVHSVGDSLRAILDSLMNI